MESGKTSSLEDLVKSTKNEAQFSTREIDILVMAYEKNRREIVYPGYTCCKRKVYTCEGVTKCEKCNVVITDLKNYYRLRLQVKDISELAWVTAWEPCANFFLGISAQEYTVCLEMKEEKVILEKLVGRQLRMLLSVARASNNKKYIRAEEIIEMGRSKITKNASVTDVDSDDDCVEVSAYFSPASAEHYQSWRRYTSGAIVENPLFSVDRSRGTSRASSVGNVPLRRSLRLDKDVEEIGPKPVPKPTVEEITSTKNEEIPEGAKETPGRWDIPSFILGFLVGITLALAVCVRLMWSVFTSKLSHRYKSTR